MSEKVNQISSVYRCRYSGWSPDNDTSKVTGYASFTPVSAGSFTLELDMYTYEQLDSELKRHFGLDPGTSSPSGGKQQQYRNHVSSLQGFLNAMGKEMSSMVGLELGDRFEHTLASYLAQLKVGEKTRRDRKCHMVRIKKVYDRVCVALEEGRLSHKNETLQSALRAAFATLGVAPKTFAKSHVISVSALQRWLNGAEPNRRGLPELRRLELALGMERDSLVCLTSHGSAASTVNAATPTGDRTNAVTAKSKIAHRELTAVLRTDRYSLPESAMGEQLVSEWRGMLKYKTAVCPALKRSRRGSWGLVPADASRVAPSPLIMVGGSCSMTAAFFLESVRGFLGFLARSAERGGGGRTQDDVQTLAWLSDGDALQSFLMFKTERSQGLMHRGQKTFASTVAGLLAKESGYIWQSPQLRMSLPEDVRPESDDAWRRQCERAYEVMIAWVAKCRDTSRLPEEPISHLLALEQPMLPVLRAIEDIRAAAALERPGSVRRAVLHRDALLLALLITNPLRERTLSALKYSKSNTGNVYRSGGTWRIRLQSALLKTGRSGDGRRYDVAVAGWVGELIDEYVAEHRLVMLAGKESDAFFVGWRTKRMSSLSKRVFTLTKRFIPDSPGFSAHAFRHLVATTLLKANPDAFVMVAELLNDRLETVIATYAHLKRDDSFARHYRFIDEQRAIFSRI